ncbi:MAG: DsbC family protein [Methylococcaceae bacterium]
MKKMINVLVMGLLGLSVSVAQADEAAIKKALAISMPGSKLDSVKASEVKGLYEVAIGSSIFYVSEDAKYLIQGRLVDIAAKKDLTEQKLVAVRQGVLAKLGKDETIDFNAPLSKHTVYVFTDIDCGYCRKLHSEMDQYFAEGISIRYLFFPRAGKGSGSYDKAVSVWCAKDRAKALTLAKQDKPIEAKTCANPIDKHMQLAEEFEVRGTPMIITDKGAVFPGYIPAKQLAEALANPK